MKILLLGKSGQVGSELTRALQPLGEVLALSRDVDDLTKFSGDVTNFSNIQTIFKEYAPDVVINATAYTAVDQAEQNQSIANQVNHLAVKHLAEQAKINNALLIHYSTDYVFSGKGTLAWNENDIKLPQNVYGQTKRLGEEALENSAVKFINFRTSWVYSAHGKNFLNTMLQLGKNRESLSVINDQIGAPTGAALIADVTAQALRYYFLHPKQQNQLLGHYHLAAEGETSWFEYAKFIFSTAEKLGGQYTLKNIQPIITAEYPTPALRPLNSRLNTQKIKQNFQIHLPTWQQGIVHVLGEILS